MFTDCGNVVDVGEGLCCGQNSSCSEQCVLKSPNHPNSYPISVYCEWTLRASEGHTVALSFDSFDIEEGSSCSYDSVQVHEIFELRKGLFSQTM